MENRQPTPVMILCGGKGSRLKEETEFKPKPMVTVGGQPILWHIMKGYAHHGYNYFILCLGYKGHMIKDYFLNHRMYSSDMHHDTACGHTIIHERPGRDDFKITFVETGEDSLTGKRVQMASKYVEGPQFMLTYGDGVSTVDIRKLHETHNQLNRDHGILGTLTGAHPRSKYGLVNKDQLGILTQFQQKPVLQDYTNGGFMVFQKEFTSTIQGDEMVEDAIIRAVDRRQMGLYNHDGFWHCMDTYEDMKRLNTLWEEGAEWRIWE